MNNRKIGGNVINNINDAFSQTNKLNNVSTDTLNSFGNSPIINIKIGRTPLNNMLEGAINVISLGAWNDLKEQQGFDKMYHLFLVFTVLYDDKPVDIIVEKLEVININTNIGSENDKTAYLNIFRQINNSNFDFDNPMFKNTSVEQNQKIIPFKYNLREIMDRTRLRMGDKNFYDYDGFTNNCQVFIINILKAMDLFTVEAQQFTFQDVSGLKAGLHPIVPYTMKKITQLGAFVSKLIGKGKGHENMLSATDAFNKYIIDSHLSGKLDEDVLIDLFIDWIEKDGIRFL